MAVHPTVSSRDALIDAILAFLGEQDLLTRADIRLALAREIDDAGPDAVIALKGRLAADHGWEYYPRDPLAQRIHYLLADSFLHPASRLTGGEHLGAVSPGPIVVVANHLSYADANVIQVLLQQAGAVDLANRLTALAGPKVFTSRERRFSSLCFGTIKVPQSAGVSSEEAVLNARDVARAARRAIEVAHERLTVGDALLLFGEGTRSRSGRMQAMLPGAARYLDVPGTWILPVGLAGPEALFPVGDSRLRPARVTAHVGQPMRADDVLRSARGDRRLAMDAIGTAVAEVVPPAYRGVYADGDRLSSAREVVLAARAAV